MRILIVGGKGFIGSSLACYLVSLGYKVAVLDKPSRKNENELESRVFQYRERMIDGCTSYEIDICSTNEVFHAFKDFNPEYVINLASISLALGAEMNAIDAVDLSTIAIKNIYIASLSTNTKKIIHFSSSYVYGDFKSLSCDETHITSPINVYGRTKLISEILCQSLSFAFNIETIIFRPISVYGVGDLNGKFSTINLNNWINKKKLSLNGGPERVNTLTHLQDINQAIQIALKIEATPFNIYNISSDEHLTNTEIRDKFLELGYNLELSEPEETILKIPVRGKLSVTKFKNKGYEPNCRFSDHLSDMITFSK